MSRGRQHDLGRGAWVAYERGFVCNHEALMHRLVETLPLTRARIVIFGKEVLTPRLTSWHGDPGCAYAYSGRTFAPEPWTPELAALRAALRATTGVDFNSVLVNHYRDGDDAMGAHADDEDELGPARDDVRIASVSLGARRRFCLRPKKRSNTAHGGEPSGLDFELGEGDLLVMGGTTQTHFRHHVPRTKRPVGPRTNLTFRVVLLEGAPP